jgi:hypothetical protein
MHVDSRGSNRSGMRSGEYFSELALPVRMEKDQPRGTYRIACEMENFP